MQRKCKSRRRWHNGDRSFACNYYRDRHSFFERTKWRRYVPSSDVNKSSMREWTVSSLETLIFSAHFAFWISDCPLVLIVRFNTPLVRACFVCSMRAWSHAGTCHCYKLSSLINRSDNNYRRKECASTSRWRYDIRTWKSCVRQYKNRGYQRRSDIAHRTDKERYPYLDWGFKNICRR